MAAKFICRFDCPGSVTPFCSQLMVFVLFAIFETVAFNCSAVLIQIPDSIEGMDSIELIIGTSLAVTITLSLVVSPIVFINLTK